MPVSAAVHSPGPQYGAGPVQSGGRIDLIRPAVHVLMAAQ